MNSSPIRDNELHACLDDELPALRRAEVEAWLAGQPEAAARQQAYAAQKAALHDLFDPVLDEALPDHLQGLALGEAAHGTVADVAADSGQPVSRLPIPRHPAWWLPGGSLQRLAAGLAIALLGGALGWIGRGQLAPAELQARLQTLPRQAAVAHAVFTPDVRRPVEIDGEHEEQLVTWLSKRMGSKMRAPKLGALGYELLGGRLLPGGSGPVAQFMYGDTGGQRLTLYVSRENSNNGNTAFRFAQEGSIGVFYWIDGAFGYALSGNLQRGELARLASAVYDQLQER